MTKELQLNMKERLRFSGITFQNNRFYLHFFTLFYFFLMLLLLVTDNTHDLSLRNNVAREECRNAKNAKIYPEVSEIFSAHLKRQTFQCPSFYLNQDFL